MKELWTQLWVHILLPEFNSRFFFFFSNYRTKTRIFRRWINKRIHYRHESATKVLRFFFKICLKAAQSFVHSGRSDFLQNLWTTQTSIKICKILSEIKFKRFLFSMLLLNANIFFKVSVFVSNDYHAILCIAWRHTDLYSKSRLYELYVLSF